MRLCLCPSVNFLSSYLHNPAPGHLGAALYALQYIKSTLSYGIYFSSDGSTSAHVYTHHPPKHDKETYTDAISPIPEIVQSLSAYSYTCWGSQVESAVTSGTKILLFKFRSFNGCIIMRQAPSVSWKYIRHDCTSLKSSEAEIRAINECTKAILTIRLRCNNLGLPDGKVPTPLASNNQGSVDMSKINNNQRYETSLSPWQLCLQSHFPWMHQRLSHPR